jgi:HAD superfamily hydrolase (TIGR01662 family)
MTELIIFDADGTLIDRDTGEILPDVEAKLLSIDVPDIAIATNQGGPACHDAGWAGSSKYPTLEEVEQKYYKLANTLGATLYMSLLYTNMSKKLYYPNGIKPDDPRANPEWRKPKPGMLLQAMTDHYAAREDTIFVGDSIDDKLASENAGIEFIHRDNFFREGDIT